MATRTQIYLPDYIGHAPGCATWKGYAHNAVESCAGSGCRFDEALSVVIGFEAERQRIMDEVVGPLVEAGQKLLNAYGEAHALYDLGDCEGSILMRAALAKAREQMGKP